MKSAIRPSQKTGAEMPKSAKPIASQATSDPALDVETTPTTTPAASQIREGPSINDSVRGAFEITFERIDTLESYE